MERESSHCEHCDTRLSIADIARGMAYQIMERLYCAPCARKLLPTLSPEGQRAFQLSCTQNREDW